MTKQAIVSEPQQSAENGTETEEKPSIWASILRDVKSSTKKAPATKSLVVLGDNESGRTTLVAKLQGNDDPKRGAGLEYHYIDVKDDDRDDTPKLGVWILDGDAACSAPLLKFAIKSDSLENTILILVASMTHPWSLLSTLKKWTALVEEHVDRLHTDPTRLRQMRDRLQYEFQHYAEPNDTSIMLTSSASSTTIKSGAGGSRVPNSLSSVSLASTSTLSPTTNGEEQIVLPLAEGVLTKSLGIPVIVVITKCDVMPTLEKENDYKDEYFDFMQHHLRKFCLEYGAALFYTSVKEKKNIDKLYKYIVHKCYGYPFSSTAAIVERDAIFIPAGWDNPKKADILLENLHRLKPADNYADVFVKPVVRRPMQRDNEIVTAEDDQEFLSKLQLTLNRAASPGRADENATPVLTRSSGTGGAGGSQTPSVASRPRNQPSTTPGSAAAAANEGALANFFNSLLTRKSGGAVTPTGSGTPVAQRQTSQSPTTPSSKRLQQHPLTFAVTPPPGRTRTPTSHKPFASPINVESPPRLLSPVAEQQGKTEASAASPTSARTPAEESKALVPVAHTNGDQPNTKDVESTQLDSMEKQPDEALRAANRDSESNITDDSNEKALNSPRRLSPATEKEPTTVLTMPDDGSNELLLNTSSVSHDLSETNEEPTDNSAVATQSRSVSPSQSNETPDVMNDIEHTSANPSGASSPTTNSNEKTLDRSASIDQKSPRTSSSPTNEQALQMNEAEHGNNGTPSVDLRNEALKSPVADISSLNDDDEQQGNAGRSANSSRRDSETKSPVRSRSASCATNELPRGDDEPESRTPFNDSDALQTVEEPLVPSSPRTEQADDADTNATGSEHRSPSPIDERQIKALMADDEQLTSPVAEQSSSSSSFAAFDDPHVDGSFPLDTGDIKFDSHETSTAVLPTEENHQRSGSPSPITQHGSRTASLFNEQTETANRSRSLSDRQGSRSSSPVVQQEQERSRTPSPSVAQKEEKSGTSSPVAEHTGERAQSPSLHTNQEQQRSRSPSPVAERNQQRSRSPSPTIANIQPTGRSSSPATEQMDEHAQSPSPVVEGNQQRSRSPSPTIKQNQRRSRSSSPTGDQKQELDRPSSPMAEQNQEGGQSASPGTQQEQQRSRSPSLVAEQNQRRSRSPSPTVTRNQPRSRSSSPTTDQNQVRSQSPSLVTQQDQQRSRSPSPLPEQSQQRSRSPSPSIIQDRSSAELSSPVIEQTNERSRSPSPSVAQNQQRSRSPSPIAKQDPYRSRSPSLENRMQRRSRSPSANTESEPARNHSPSSFNEQNVELNENPVDASQDAHQRSRSPLPATNQKELRSRSPSPSTIRTLERVATSSTVDDQQVLRSRSPSPIPPQRRQSNQPTSPTHERSRSPSTTDDHQPESIPEESVTNENQRRDSPSRTDNNALNSLARKDSRSPTSRSPEPDENKSSHSSSNFEFESTPGTNESIATARESTMEQRVGSRSPSPIVTNNRDESAQKSPLSSSLITENPLRSPSPFVTTNSDNQMSPPEPVTTNSPSQPAVSPVEKTAPSETQQRASKTALNDRSQESNVASNALPAVHRKASITRSQSQSMLSRPNTLQFSPNEHNLDGLYMSNDDIDEDEILDDNDHHHNSAPSTVSVEFRRSSLLHDQNTHPRQTPIDPDDILRRLSLVEKSRAEDSENAPADSTNAKDS